MADKQNKQDTFNKEQDQARYGSSGNEGIYGEGQYTSQGEPDQQTEQARQMHPRTYPPQKQQKEREQTTKQGETAEQANRELEGKQHKPAKKLSTN